MKKYEEKIVDGTMSGFMKLNDTVTWVAKHLFKERRLTIRVSSLKRPDYFVDEQVKGDFISLKHEHYFKEIQNGTLMIDQFHYESLKGWKGKILDRIYLHSYMTKLLEERNAMIKQAAEGSLWKQYLTA